MRNSSVTPSVKWAGGKRQLLTQIRERMLEKYNRYYEPFIGRGTILFELQSGSATINDTNKTLVNTHKCIRSEPFEFLKFIDRLDEEVREGRKEYFYPLREHYNDRMVKEEFDVEMIVLLVLLNKHRFNRLYRINEEGLFNVPYNNSRRKSVNEGSIKAILDYLKSVGIIEGNFEETYESTGEGDLIFAGSPYAPLGPASSESYTREGFDVESHKRLANLSDELTTGGCCCMLTNHNTEFVNELYGNRGYKIDMVSVEHSINADVSKRVGEEVIICNYQSRSWCDEKNNCQGSIFLLWS